MIRKKLISIAAMVATTITATAVTPLWLRDAKISPDGKSIAFCYKGDIWCVDSDGGQAKRLTATPDYEASPVWSPDSKSIAFSSNRHGNDDIYIMPAIGGAPTRLTFNSATETPEAFSPDGKSVLFSASIQDPVTSAMFPTSRMPELYSVPVKGGRATQVLATPARYISFMPDGCILYQDIKGMENEWRKHQNSSVTCDVWLYNPANGKHTNLTQRQGEDRNPVASNGYVYFLSERNGDSMNVYRATPESLNSPQEVTNFKKHPVRFLSADNNGTLCFTYDGEIYTMNPEGKPRLLSVTLTDDYVEDPMKLSVGRPSEMTVSPDGKSIAFISRGNVFVTSVDYTTTKQITETPEAERWVSWGHDSKSLYYTSERDGIFNIYKATMARQDDPNFANATIIKEEPVFAVDKHERTVPKVSPDGKYLAFILDRNTLAMLEFATGKVTNLTDGTTYKQRDATFKYDWRPDSKWIVLEVTDRDPYTDIAIINIADGKLTNITKSGYFDEQPRWAMQGDAIIYASERYGMRNHASWGSMYDVMAVFMNQEAFDRYNMNKEDAELAADAAKKAADNDTVSNKHNIEIDGISDRIVRLTPLSTDLKDFVLNNDGDKLYFITGAEKGNTLWEYDLREHSVGSTKNIAAGLGGFETSADGKKLFILGSSMQQFTPSGMKLTPINYSGVQKIFTDKERQYMFDNIVREERQRFYDANMHGVDWTALTDHYRKFLPHINNNLDFSEMASEMLGELNVSHTGCRMYGTSGGSGDRTASLGLLFDLNNTEDELTIAEVIKGGPLSTASSKAAPGIKLVAVNGTPVSAENDLSILLTDAAGKKTLVTMLDPATGNKWDEVVKPVSASRINDLLYKRWVEARAADVDRMSNGRLGYVHIASMNDASFRNVYSDMLGKYLDKEGIVVDIRWNGGGRLHEDVEVLLTGQKYLTQMIRGNKSADMPSRRWNKPSVMLISEACYSNAHGTPWVYKHMNIGKLVGMPVPGTMTSVNWVTMQDPSMYFGIPVVGYLTAEGKYLENSQLDPDIKVANNPADIVNGDDQQLRSAVLTLLKQIDSQTK